MRFPLKEPLLAKYLYISPENIVHIFMPVVSGTAIGLDNTCKAVSALKDFFGKESNSNKKATLKGELLAYKEALENDLSLWGANDAALTQQKQERLTQIDAYLEVIKQLENHSELDCLNKASPYYPRPLEAIMQDREKSNLYSMVLRPTNEDGYLRSEAANPTFSVAHKSEARHIQQAESALQQALIHAYTPLTFEDKDSKSQVIQQTLAQLDANNRPVDFEQLRTVLQRTVEALLNVSVDFTKTQQGTVLTQKDIEVAMGFNPTETSPKDYIEALLGYCAPKLFGTIIESPFNTLINKEAWSIATQFLLGITNIYGVVQGKLSPETNFGKILDSHPDLSKNLADTLASAKKTNNSMEEACLSWINAHKAVLKLKADLTQEDIKAIKDTFAKRYTEIKDSPHFDEFFILDASKKGSFFVHQGSICASFTEFASSPIFDLPQALTQPLEKARKEESTLNTEIPHKNPLVQGEVEIDTLPMNNTELQALYERIHTYNDPKLKKHLLAQLKQERPDFKPQTKNAKQFLQHVAYGEQNEAEALLKKDPELAQALLRAHNIPFTDYSGRTFTCTAYEYAYWAKDSHMQRMLEKYIRQDGETRQFILKQVETIEELVLPPAALGCFSRFFASLKPRPKGLHYTTQDKLGQTLDHSEAHFDLTPLKQALKAFIDAFDNNPKRTNADWEALDKLWIKVGLPQVGIPAHIAHEYCHPKRSFADVVKKPSLLDASNPANLERQLKFYNYVTNSTAEWFTPQSFQHDSDLGVSFAILRGEAGCGPSGGSRGAVARMGGRPHVDLFALTAIDEARTNDLKQSLENLSQPLNSPTP